MVDHMLIKLGKYLRILGYDAEWNFQQRTHELILKANLEGRIFVTRNTRLPHQYPAVSQLMVLTENDPQAQLQLVIEQYKLDAQSELFSKCIRCNVLLESVQDKETIREKVHPNVLARYDQFFSCPRCGTVFWHGSHVRNTCRKLKLDIP